MSRLVIDNGHIRSAKSCYMNALLDLLHHYQLPYQIHEHEPVFTVEQCQHLYEKMPGAHCKTLFLKDKKKALFLVSLMNHKQADLKALSKILGNGHLTFCSPQELNEKLKLIPGAVTPYALLHDNQNEISFVLDRDLLQCEIINFHPFLDSGVTIFFGTGAGAGVGPMTASCGC